MAAAAVVDAADFVEEGRPPEHVAARAGFGGDVRREMHDLAGVLQQIVAEVVSELEASHEPCQPRVQVEHAQAERRLRAGFLGERFELLPDLGDDLLDAGGVDPAVLEEPLNGNARDLAPHRVERRQQNRARRVVDDDVDPGGHLEGADVPALATDDPAFHLVGGERDERDRGFDRILHAHPLGRIDDEPPRGAVGAFARFLLDAPGEHRRFFPRFHFDRGEKLGSGLGNGELRDALEQVSGLLPILFDRRLHLANPALRER